MFQKKYIARYYVRNSTCAWGRKNISPVSWGEGGGAKRNRSGGGGGWAKQNRSQFLMSCDCSKISDLKILDANLMSLRVL